MALLLSLLASLARRWCWSLEDLDVNASGVEDEDAKGEDDVIFSFCSTSFAAFFGRGLDQLFQIRIVLSPLHETY